MLTAPDLPDEVIIACLQNEYDIRAVQLSFLPVGADRNTAVYRVVAEDEAQHFLKLRRGIFDETSVTLPKFLSDLGVEPIIAPVAIKTGQLWASMDAFKEILYDSLSERVAAFLKNNRVEILDLIGRAERLAVTLQAQSPEFVLCHSDTHGGNILIDVSGALFIVDWDEPILAPKERDLMFIGGAWYRTAEEALFYQGYGRTQLDPVALAYYRYERIVEDTAIFCERILLAAESSEDREQCFRFLSGAFLPDNIRDMVYRSDTTGGRWSETSSSGRGLSRSSALKGG